MDVYRERELKFDVPPAFELPDIEVGRVLVGSELERRTVMLSSAYHDTTGLDLLARRMTLRRRTGDIDAGWQLKMPAGDARDEVRVPLDGSAVDVVPEALVAVLAGTVGAEQLAPVARLHTERHLLRVVTAAGLVVEIADDRVTAVARSRTTSWREVEVELGPAGGEADLARFAQLLTQAGAQPSHSGSKLARALGRSG